LRKYWLQLKSEDLFIIDYLNEDTDILNRIEEIKKSRGEDFTITLHINNITIRLHSQ